MMYLENYQLLIQPEASEYAFMPVVYGCGYGFHGKMSEHGF
jgi:hypothetical protein